MPIIPPVGTVFVALAVIFLGLCLRDVLKTEAKLTPARQTWLHVSLIFAAAAIGIYLAQVVLR